MTTGYQVRKHYSQMSPTEVGMLVGMVRANASEVSGQAHYEHRASERHFTLAQAVDAVASGKPVEVSKVGNDIRALFRRQSGPSAGTCAVVSLITWNIITVYYNDPRDTHDTLNHSLYRWNVDVVELVKGLTYTTKGRLPKRDNGGAVMLPWVENPTPSSGGEVTVLKYH
jgi:hypothetical protein